LVFNVLKDESNGMLPFIILLRISGIRKMADSRLAETMPDFKISSVSAPLPT